MEMPTKPPTRSLEEAIGAEVKRRREAAGVTQDAVAVAAQAYGLDWSQPTISAIEGGRRNLSFGEVVLLTHILVAASVTPGPLHFLDLVPATYEWVRLAGIYRTSLMAVRSPYGVSPAWQPVVDGAELDDVTSSATGTVRDAITETDRKAARALHMSPEAIAAAARSRWGHGLAEERDRRVGDPSATPQKRGRVTRELVRELKRRKGR